MPDLTALALASRISTAVPSSTWATVRAAITGGLQYSAMSFDGTRYYLSHGLSGGNTASVALTVVTADGTTSVGTSGQNPRYLGRGAFLNGKHYVVGGRSVGGQVFQFVDAYTPAGTDGTSGTWANFANLPLGLVQHDVVTLGGFLYSVAGTTTTASADASGLLYRYDPTANTWATLTGMGIARYAGSAVAAGGRIYYLGGYDVNGAAVTTASMYDVTAGTWTALPTMPAIVAGPGAAFVVGTRAYVPTLADPSVLNVLDLASLTWSQVRGVGTPVTAHLYGASFVAGNVVTAFSGSSTTQSMERLDLTASIDTTTPGLVTVGALPAIRSAAAVSTDGTRIYASHGNVGATYVGTLDVVTATGTTTVGTAAVSPRLNVAGAWSNGRHYAIGGEQSGSTTPTQAVEAYTPAGTNGATGTWATLANLPAQVGLGAAAGLGTFVYFAGGRTGATQLSTFYRYDTVAGTWATLAAMPATRAGGALVALGTRLYYIGGYDSAGTASAVVYVFDVTAGTWSTSPFTLATVSNGAVGTVGAVLGSTFYYNYGGGGFAFLNLTTGVNGFVRDAANFILSFPVAHTAYPGVVVIGSVVYVVSGTGTTNVDTYDTSALSPFARRVRLLQQYLSAVGLPAAYSVARRIALKPPVSGWSTIGNTPDATPRSQSCVSTDGNRIYVSNGYYTTTGAQASGYTISVTGTITAMPPTPVAKQNAAGAWCNGRHWSIGGADSNQVRLARVDSYTPAGTDGASGSWTTNAPLPSTTSSYGGAAAVIGNFIYYAGGSGTTDYTGGTNTLYRYDTTANTWTSLAAMPGARTNGAMVVVSGKLYYLGGWTTSSAATANIFIYDPSANTWSSAGGSLAIATAAGWAAVYNGLIYYNGGSSGAVATTTVRTIDPVSFLVGTAADLMPIAHTEVSAAVVIGSAIYVVTGQGTTNVDRIDFNAVGSYTAAVRSVRALTAANL